LTFSAFFCAFFDSSVAMLKVYFIDDLASSEFTGESSHHLDRQ
jgi:hypothetical protein